MECIIIVACTQERVIGHRGKLPWRMPADLEFFKTQTLGYPVIMGRKTLESLPHALPGRELVVITRQQHYQPKYPCAVTHGLAEALAYAKALGTARVFIAGGSEVYAEALEQADTLYLTLIKAAVPGDTYFPAIDPREWHVVKEEAHDADIRNPHPYTFITYKRSQT